MRKIISSLLVMVGLVVSYNSLAENKTPNISAENQPIKQQGDNQVSKQTTADEQEDTELNGLESAPEDNGNDPDYD
jgi:hypothetical protein